MRKSKKLRSLWYRLSTNQRFLIRRLYYYPLDLKDKLAGKRHKYVPPRGFIYTGSPAGAIDYLNQGRHQVSLLKEEINLKTDDAILDIGSGVGRTAIALTEYLNNNARYEGFDVVKKGVEWCNSKLSKDYSNFNFRYVPLFNDLYNTSPLKAEEFKFPYQSNAFNKVFSFSVFTHMQIDEIENYFFEMERVLKKGGMALHTFFTYNSYTKDYISNKESFGFPVDKGDYKLMHKDVTSGNICISENRIRQMAQKTNLQVVKIIDGFWKDGQSELEKKEYQDIVVLKKK